MPRNASNTRLVSKSNWLRLVLIVIFLAQVYCAFNIVRITVEFLQSASKPPHAQKQSTSAHGINLGKATLEQRPKALHEELEETQLLLKQQHQGTIDGSQSAAEEPVLGEFGKDSAGVMADGYMPAQPLSQLRTARGDINLNAKQSRDRTARVNVADKIDNIDGMLGHVWRIMMTICAPFMIRSIIVAFRSRVAV